ncbi:hypothetical protein [Flavobacterium poyangense]|nr:hypothetical protein [Flavobacterium sp. JXAS1]
MKHKKTPSGREGVYVGLKPEKQRKLLYVKQLTYSKLSHFVSN